MTPNNIAGMATLKGLQILALTDHTYCKNCPAFFEACRQQGIIPIAGMELSTAEDIHLVCLFESLDSALAFDKEIESHLLPVRNRPEIFGNQWIMDQNDEVIGAVDTLLISATDLWLRDAVDLARRFGAHVHPAHIDRESNGIISILGDIPSEYGFNQFEFNDQSNVESYSKQYSAIDAECIVVCSDAHHLWDISEADHSILLNDEPYSSSFVRKKLFDHLNRSK
jgi:hypothetical protein